MASKDHVRRLSPIVIPDAAPNGVRFNTTGENNKRTEQFNVRVTGRVNITVAGAGAPRNRGSILSQIGQMGLTVDGADRMVIDARLNQFIAECMAPSPLPNTRLATTGVQDVVLSEVVPLWLSAPKTANMNETKLVEVNKQLAIQPFLTPNRAAANLSGGAPTIAITDLQAEVFQVYDDLIGIPPWLTAYVRTITVNVNAANPNLRIDMRGSRFMRGFFIQQDSDQGEQTGIIQSLIFRGDSQSVIGDQGVPYEALRLDSAEQFGGELPPGYFGWDFARYGRLSAFWNPFQDTNARLELNVAPLGGGVTGDTIRVGIVEYERTAANARELPITI